MDTDAAAARPPSDWRALRRLLGYLRPYPVPMAGALVAVTGNSLLQLAPPYLTKVVIDRYVGAGDLAGIAAVARLYLITLVAAAVLECAQTYILQLTAQRVMFDLRLQIYGHLQRLGLPFFDRNPVGRLMTRVTTDVDVLNELFTSGVHAIFFDLFTLAGVIVLLVAMDWRLALVTFSVVPLVALVTQWFRRNVRQSFRDVRAWVARLNAHLQENIVGIATVQLFRREEQNQVRFKALDAGHREANLAAVFYYAVFYPAIEVLATVATASILWFGGADVIGGRLTLGSLVAFLLYAQRFFRPVTDISEKLNSLQAAIAAAERVFSLLDTPVGIEASLSDRAEALSQSRPDRSRPEGLLQPRPGEAAREAARPEPTGLPVSTVAAGLQPCSAGTHITFDHVWFAYDGVHDVLRDVSFEVAAGERVGIVGATGSGKSTIINLLLRFYDVRAGRILVDGEDVRRLPLDALRARFGLVLQDVQLFSGSIASNVRLGDSAIADQAVARAVEAVGAGRFIAGRPGGLDAAVAERGTTLSAGQKQLLSFARALAFDRPVLVLDEATSAIDTETELAIREALNVAMADRTTMAIAHRLSTVQDMDKILVLHKGELREAGTHRELLGMDGLYARLWQMQQGRVEGGRRLKA